MRWLERSPCVFRLVRVSNQSKQVTRIWIPIGWASQITRKKTSPTAQFQKVNLNASLFSRIRSPWSSHLSTLSISKNPISQNRHLKTQKYIFSRNPTSKSKKTSNPLGTSTMKMMKRQTNSRSKKFIPKIIGKKASNF